MLDLASKFAMAAGRQSPLPLHSKVHCTIRLGPISGVELSYFRPFWGIQLAPLSKRRPELNYLTLELDPCKQDTQEKE